MRIRIKFETSPNMPYDRNLKYKKTILGSILHFLNAVSSWFFLEPSTSADGNFDSFHGMPIIEKI